MKKFILTLAIAALSVAFATQADAAPKSGPGNGTQHSISKGIGANKIANYHLQHGTKFEHGFYFKGKHHEHWGEVRFDSRYGCNCYWDSCLSTWFYWCEREVRYYPISYCPYRTYVCPVVVERPIIVERPIVVVERPIVVVERPIVIVRPAPVVIVQPRPVVVVQPLCECQPPLGASIAPGGVLRTSQPPLREQPLARQ